MIIEHIGQISAILVSFSLIIEHIGQISAILVSFSLIIEHIGQISAILSFIFIEIYFEAITTIPSTTVTFISGGSTG
jgi:hypothetical protein